MSNLWTFEEKFNDLNDGDLNGQNGWSGNALFKVTTDADANLAVTPPGYLFTCGSNATLAIRNNSASLIHYSIGYFKESA